MIPFRRLLLRRGLKVNLPVLAEGELGFCTDTKEIFVGSSSGNIKVGASSVWTKTTKTYADLAAAALSNDIELFQLPGKAIIHGVVIIPTQAFTGGALGDYTVSVGITGQLQKYASAFDVFSAPGATDFQTSEELFMENITTPTSVRLAAASTSANLNQATQGSVDVYVLISALP